MAKRLDVARAVAAQLYEAENAIDDAIREAARLTVAVTDARCDLNLAAVVGGDVFDRAAALQAGLARARTDAVALHHALAGVRDLLRIRMDDAGADFGNPDKPPGLLTLPEAGEDAPRRLRTI